MVAAERAAFLAWARRVDVRRLVFLDESGANLAMGRSHAWLPRGHELIEPRPMNWGDNLSLVGATRLTGWVTMATGWDAINTSRFVAWVRRRLVPRLRPGDIVVMDNLSAHKHAVAAIRAAGANVLFLPPYSPEYNPIEKAWAKLKDIVRRAATLTREAFERAVAAAMDQITIADIRAWTGHSRGPWSLATQSVITCCRCQTSCGLDCCPPQS